MSKKRADKNRFSKFIVTLVVIINILFTAAVLYVFLKVKSEPVTLIGCWFAFTTGELWMLASIKKRKITEKGVIAVERDQLEAEADK